MRKFILLVMCVVCTYAIQAQNQYISGKVVEQSNQTPLNGATVRIDKKTAVTTDSTGSFKVPCTEQMTLEISHIGFENQVISATCGQTLAVGLVASTERLNAVEITAISTPDKSQLEQAQSIVKLGTTEIKRGTGLYLADAINTNVPGVYMESRSNSGGQQINIRGYGNGMGFKGVSNNFDMQGSKVYLNGIPLTDAEGITILDDIDFGSISQVEIAKGPSGTLYGLAIAGVVNLQTQKAEKNKTYVEQGGMGGSYGLLRTNTRLSIGGEHASLLVNYGHQSYDGFMPHTASQKDFVNVVVDFDLNERQKVSTYFGFSDSYDERNGELTEEQYETFDYSGNARYVKNDAHSAVKTFRAGLSHTYAFTHNISNTTTVFGSSQSIDQSSAGGWTDKTPLSYGFRTTFDTKFEVGNDMLLSGMTGLEMQRTTAQTIGYGMGADSTNLAGYNIITNTRSNQYSNNSTYSYFTQWTLKLPKGFSVNAGLGISNSSLNLDDRLWANSNNHPGNDRLKDYSQKYTNLVSPNVAINKTFGKTNSVYVAYSEGYKTPVGANVIISTTGQLNTGLRPEHGSQLELGTKGSLLDNRLYYTLAVFQTTFDDKFTTETVQNEDNTATLYSYLVNGGSLDNKGLEVLVQYEAIKSKGGIFTHVRPFANFTYSDFKYKDFDYNTIGDDVNGNDSTVVHDYSGNAVAGVSPYVFNLGIDAETKWGVYGNINYNFRGEMPFTSDGLHVADSFNLLNAKVGWKTTFGRFGFDVYAGANNITGEQSYAMVFVNQLPDAYIPAPNDINFFGGVNVKYNF